MANPHNISIALADMAIEVNSPLSAAELGIEPRLGPFFGVPEKPRGRVALRWEESVDPPVPHGRLIYDPGAIWRMYRKGADWYAALAYPVQGRTAQTRSVLRANAAWDDVTLTEQRTGTAWQSLLGIGAGELLLRAALLFTGGLLFHASGLDDNGRGIVFVGHSGAGKSTQTGLWHREPGVIAMNDDRMAVRVEDSGPRCYGTPWGGAADIARNHAAPLAALVVLEQASENTIQPISPAQAAALLTARAFLPYWDRSSMVRAMANLNAIVTHAPVYRLRCRPEKAVIPLVRSVV